MKKFLALLLACVMLCSTLSVIAAEAPEADSETQEVITLLKYLGIITDGEKLDENVSRADFAVYAAKLMKLESKSGQQYFDDVGSNVAEADAINALAEYGFISSGEGIKFMPYNNIRTTEAIKVFMSMLGYSEICKAHGGYPQGYLNMASRIDLNKGIGSEYLTRGQLFAMLYRTLVEPFCMPSLIGLDGSMEFEKDDGNNILLQYHELNIIDGYVDTVGKISVDTQSTLDEGEFRIDNKVIRTDLIENDMYEYLGTNIRVYYFETDSIKATAAIVIPFAETNDVLSFRKDELSSVDDGGKGYIFSYINENDQIKKVEIPRGAVIIKNGETVITDVYKELNIDKGSYKFVDTDGDGKYDVLFVYEYYNIVVGTIEDKEGMVFISRPAISDVAYWEHYRGRVGSRRAIYDKYTNDLSINLTEDGNKVIKYKDTQGKLIDISNIVKDEVISVYKSKNGRHIEVYKSADPVKGEITEISQTGEGGQTTYEIVVGGKSYKIDKSVEDKNSHKLAVGLKATFYLDCFGKIGNYVPDTKADIKFAYLIEAHQDIKGLEKSAKVKIFTQDSEILEFVLGDRIKIDGRLRDTDEDAYAALSSHTKQPIRFSLDEEDNLVYVDTLYHDAKLEGSVSIYETLEEGTYTKGSNRSSFSDTLIYKSATPVFYVPEDAVVDKGQYLEEHFYTKKFSNLANDTNINKLSSYRVDREGIFDDLIIIKTGNVISGFTEQNVYLIDRVVNVLNSDGDRVQCVYAYLNGSIKKLYCTSDCEDLSSKLSKGDIVWFDVNSNGDITSLEDIVVDVTNGKAVFNPLTTLTGGEKVWAVAKKTDSSKVISANGKWAGSTLSSYFSMVCGYAGKTKDGALCFSYDKDDALNGNYDFVKNIGSISIMVYDKEQGKDGSIYKSGIDDIITVGNSYDDCSMVLMMMRNKNLKTVYVYK